MKKSTGAVLNRTIPYIPGACGYEPHLQLLDTMIDAVGENENHPLASLMEMVGVLVEKYEDEHVPELAAM